MYCLEQLQSMVLKIDFNFFLEELVSAHASEAAAAPQPAVQHAEFSAWRDELLESEEFEDQRAFWRRREYRVEEARQPKSLPLEQLRWARERRSFL